MKKLFGLILSFVILFSSFSLPVFATNNKYGIIRSDIGIKIRNGAGTSFNSIGTGAADGQVVTILDTVNTQDDTTTCVSGIWYKIKYNQVEEGFGYACSNFVEILNLDVNSEFEATLLTFPESYRNYLSVLHAIYPNATFVAYNTELNFEEAVNNENVLGKSLLWDTYPNNYRDGLKNLDSYNIITNTFDNTYPGGGNNWYAASHNTIAYYMDPRNFLSEDRIFMFESQSYSASLHTIDGVEKILTGSYMANAFVDNSNITFAQAIMDAAVKYNISPYFIASRILQEVGLERSSLVLGTYNEYPEFNGYYNYYNIGAGGDNVVYNGLSKAKEQGWDSEYKAIVEGSYWIGKNYIMKGQDTTYFQKWNVVCKTGEYDCYTHQYMQNVEAPYSEANITYKAYKNNLGKNMYEAPYVFTIPIYNLMPENVILPSNLNPINYLKSLIVNDSLIANFDPLITDYSITIPSNMSSINIQASSIVDGAIIEGIGDIEVTDKKIIPIKVKALNGTELIYNIKVNLNDDITMNLSDTLNNLKSGKITDNYLSGLTNVAVIKEAFNKANSAALIEIKDKKGNIITDGSVATGYKVSITVGDTTKELSIVINGDINGDSEINTLDIVEIQREILKMEKLSNEKFISADLNSDGEVNTLDIIVIQRHILEFEYISQ